MKNGTITYAPRLTTEIQHFGICFVCTFRSVFKNNFTNALILFSPAPSTSLLFLCQHWSVLLCALLNCHHFKWKCKRQKLSDVQTRHFLKFMCAKLYCSCNPDQHNCIKLLSLFLASCFLSFLQLVRRSYISRCGRKSTQTAGVWGLSGQREWERPWRVLHVRQVGDKGSLEHPHFAHCDLFCTLYA